VHRDPRQSRSLRRPRSRHPNTAELIAPTGAPLVLAGHTHAGQVDVPWITRRIARAAGHPYLRGFYRIGERTDLYVNAGIGHSFPGFRTGSTCPEVSVFDLDPNLATRRTAVAFVRAHDDLRTAGLCR